MDNNKRHFLLKSITDQAQNPSTRAPGVGTVGAWVGQKAESPSRVRCSPKGPKLGFEYLPTYKNLHRVRTACMAFPLGKHTCTWPKQQKPPWDPAKCHAQPSNTKDGQTNVPPVLYNTHEYHHRSLPDSQCVLAKENVGPCCPFCTKNHTFLLFDGNRLIMQSGFFSSLQLQRHGKEAINEITVYAKGASPYPQLERGQSKSKFLIGTTNL